MNEEQYQNIELNKKNYFHILISTKKNSSVDVALRKIKSLNLFSQSVIEGMRPERTSGHSPIGQNLSHINVIETKYFGIFDKLTFFPFTWLNTGTNL